MNVLLFWFSYYGGGCGKYRILQIIQDGKVSRYAKLNSNLLKNICGWTVVLYGQGLFHWLLHWKSFTATN